MSKIVWSSANRRVVDGPKGLTAQMLVNSRWRVLSGEDASETFKMALGGKCAVAGHSPAPASQEVVAAQKLLQALFGQHPWHGVSPGDNVPDNLTAYIEIVPTDTVKYELDKASGLLKIDRPHRFSNICPALYGFIPQTYCGDLVGQRCSQVTGKKNIKGDGDPLDICVLTQKPVSHGDILVHCTPIGGLRMIDGDEADDKIIAVLENDAVYGDFKDISDCPEQLINPLRHYFLTYKQIPGESRKVRVKIAETYGRQEANEVIRRSMHDYAKSFGSPARRIAELAGLLTSRIS